MNFCIANFCQILALFCMWNLCLSENLLHYYYFYHYWIVARWFLPTDMLYFLRYGVSKTPHTSITCRSILLVCIKKVFCNSVIFVSILMVLNLFSSSLAGVPRAPVTNGTTITFIFHTFFSSLTRSKYFSIFSTFLSSTLVSQDIAKSIIWHSWCFLSMKIMSGFLAVIKWSVCTVKSQSILHESFLRTASGWCSYHFD